MRLKLTAPGVCGRIAFVNDPVRRRSLGAIRWADLAECRRAGMR
jgi:hypothetical protein